jgi:hypothetical protein
VQQKDPVAQLAGRRVLGVEVRRQSHQSVVEQAADLAGAGQPRE